MVGGPAAPGGDAGALSKPPAGQSVRPTKKQKLLLDFIGQFIAEHGYSPSYREIMNGCGYSSIATVAVHINNLIARGHLRKRDHSARSLELAGTAANLAAGGAAARPAIADADGTPAVSSEAAWLRRQVESRLNAAEQAATVTPQQVRDAEILCAALQVLGLLDAAGTDSLAARLEVLKGRLDGGKP